MPTEAEWEHACRAGTTTKYSFGDDDAQLEKYAWFADNSGNIQFARHFLESDPTKYNQLVASNDCQTHPVGLRQPNPWGLYDMHGNVWEWCSDWYGDYPKDAVIDPRGPSSASDQRVLRGGCWYSPAGRCGSADRLTLYPSDYLDYVGFRLALSLSGVQPIPPEAVEKRNEARSD